MPSLAEQWAAEDRARREAAAAQARTPRSSPGKLGPDGKPRPRRRPGPAKRWPLREWVKRGVWAKTGRAGQLYGALLVLANPKSRQYSGGRERLAEACNCGPDNITLMLERLEDLGMIRRQQTKQTVNGAITSGLFVWIVDPPELPTGDAPAVGQAGLPGMGEA